ncbi:hypothetical protein [Pandoraea norimbergensis]|uniref:hypothetical protein n=1 Tax=Pandoraea norimbergensis TaxID=93219 RepID=UPI000A80B52A|nr:hypothetical protein [Pandoraea norimbergensis]
MTKQALIAQLTEKQNAAKDDGSIKEIPQSELDQISGAGRGNAFVNATWSRAM